jgi:hypothetical protein
MVQAMQSLRSGHVDFGPAVPGILLPAMAKDPSLDLVSVYKWLPRNANVIVVKPGSPIKSAGDLARKRIGVRNQGDPGVVVTKLMLAEGNNFPELAQFYNEEVVKRGSSLFTSVLERGIARGEFRPVDPAVMTQVLIAPVMMLMMWLTTAQTMERMTVITARMTIVFL